MEDVLGERPVDDARRRAADLERPPWADTQEAVAPDALATLDRLEQVRRTAVVHAQEGTDRRLQVGVTRDAQEDRVGVARQTLDLGQAERARHRHVVALDLRRIRTTFRPLPGRKVETFRGATRLRRPVARCRARRRRTSTVDRCCPDNAGALRRSLLAPCLRVTASRPFGPEAPGSIRHRPRTGFHQPPALSAEGSTGTRPVHRPSSIRRGV